MSRALAITLLPLLLLPACATKEELERCKLELPPLSTNYKAAGVTRLHDMRRLSAVNEARNFCVDGEIKIEEDRASTTLERAACPDFLEHTRVIRVSCPKGTVPSTPKK